MRTLVRFLCKFYPCLIVALASLNLSSRGYAEASSATLSVSVADTSGAIIANASVIIRNVDTNQEQQTLSGKSGTTTFSFLKPGRYSLMVSKETFADITVDNIVLNVGDDKRVALLLKIGPTTQSVTVDGSGLNIDTSGAAVSTVIDRGFVANIPLNGRSLQDLILTTPGIVTQSPQTSTGIGANGNFSVNGQRTESNNYSVDGVSANTSAGVGGTAAASNISGNVSSSTALGTTQSLVSVDALQEFRVNSSSYSAEYGRTPGGQFSFVTRSGTDDLHGSLFEYFRNDLFDANNWFNDYYDTPKQALRQNDFGGTLGGPIRIPVLYNGKDRSFFFFSYEGLRLDQPQPASLQYVPSLSLRQQAPAALQPILNAFPLPTVGKTDFGNGLAQFIQSDSLPSQIDSTSIRIDQAVSSKVRLFFRFSDSPSNTAARILSVYEPISFKSHTYTFGATGQLSRHLTDDLRVGYVTGRSNQQELLDNFDGATPVNLPNALAASNVGTAKATFVFFVAGTGVSELYAQNAINQMKQWNVTDSLSWTLGAHQIKFGVDYRNVSVPITPSSPYIIYEYIGQAGVVSNKSALAEAFVDLPAAPIYTNFSAYGQDEWRLTQRVNLSLGLRWEVNPPPSAANGDLPYVLQGNVSEPSSLSLAPKGTPLWKTAWYNFAPRIGVAWTANRDAGHETVLRAGAGVFFDTGNQTASFGYNGIGYQASQLAVSGSPAPFPGGVTVVPSITPPYKSATVFGIYPHLQLPFTLEWNLALEQAFGKYQTLTITYVGSNGRRLLEENEFSLASHNPQFGNVSLVTNGPTSNYQSLQTKYQRTVVHGLQTLASYTWSHSLDYGSNDAVLPIVRGNSDFDLRNSASGGISWQLPSFSQRMFVKRVFGDWSLDGYFIVHTGFPVTLLGNQSTDPTTGSEYYSGVNLVPNQQIYLHTAGLPGNRVINHAAFSLPTSGLTGNAPRNFVRGFGAKQLNLAIHRDLKLRESLSLQFRAESFNVVNHPNFGRIDSFLTDATFGQATQTLNQSIGTTSPLYQMGGPRSTQFALKLQF